VPGVVGERVGAAADTEVWRPVAVRNDHEARACPVMRPNPSQPNQPHKPGTCNRPAHLARTETMDRIFKPLLYAEAAIRHFWRLEFEPAPRTARRYVETVTALACATTQIHALFPGA
jgi:hypothetical protein